jgi:hypothetical protein
MIEQNLQQPDAAEETLPPEALAATAAPEDEKLLYENDEMVLTLPVEPEKIARSPEADAQAIYINGIAADDVGIKPPSTLDWSEQSKVEKTDFLSKLESKNSAERIQAIEMIAQDWRVPMEVRLKAMDRLALEITQGEEVSRAMNAPRVAAQVAYAEQGGDIDRTYEMILKNATDEGRAMQEAQVALPMKDNIEVLKKIKGLDASKAANVAINYVNDKAKFWSTDTLSLVAFGPQEQLRGVAFLKALNNPSINAFLDDKVMLASAYTIGWGSVKGQVSDIIAKLPEKEQRKLVEDAVKYLGVNNMIGTDGNALIEADVITSIFHTISKRDYVLEGIGFDEETSRKIGESFENMASTLNYAGIGQVVKAPFRGAAFGIRSVFGMFSKTAPRKIGKDLAEAAANPDVARVLGTTPEDILASVTPSARKLLQEPNISVNAFSDIIQAEMRRNTLKRDLFEAMRTSVSRVPVEAVATTYTKFAGRNGVVGQPQLSAVEVVGDSLNITGRYGAGQDAGFNSAEDALKHFRKVFPTATEKDVEVSLRHKPSNTIVDKTDEMYDDAVEVASRPENAKDFDWFLDVNHSTAISNLDSLDDFVDASFIGQKLAPLNRILFKGLGGYERLWDNTTNNTINQLSSRHRFVSATIENLAGPEIRKVIGTAEEGALNEVLFKNAGADLIMPDELAKKHGITSHNGKMAYYAYRAATDILHDVADLGLADSKRKEGFKRLFNAEGNQINLAREIDPKDIWARADKSNFVDPMTGEVTTLNAASLASRMEAGETLMELDNVIWHGNREVPYALVKKEDSITAIGNIGIAGILPKAMGYYPEMWKGSIAIRGVSETGRSYLLAIAENADDAKQWIKNNAANYEKIDPETGAVEKRFPKGIDFEFDKSLRDPIKRANSVGEVYENTKGVIYGQKSNATIHNASPTGDAIAVDPLASLQAASQVLADNVTKGKLLQHMMNQFDTFARENGLADPSLPSSVRIDGVDKLIDGSKLADPEHKRLYDNAVAWGQTIGAVAITPDTVDTVISNGMKGLASFIAGSFAGSWSAGKYLEASLLKRAGANNDVGAWLQKWTHFTNIVTSPHRQFAMNAASSLTNLAHPRGYAYAVSNLATFENLLYMEMAWAKGAFTKASDINNAYANAAKAMGMSVEETKALIKAYRTSGLYEQTAHHWLAKNAVRTEQELAASRLADGGYKPMKHSLGGVFKKGVEKTVAGKDAIFERTTGVFNALGFEMGEHLNTMSTFLTQYHTMRGQKGFSLTKNESMRELVGKTQTWIGNMTAEGRSTYQSGIFKNFFQYIAFQHKMLANILPSWAGGVKALTWTEKWALASTQLLLWGSQANVYGRGLRLAVEEGIFEDDDITADEAERRLQAYRDSGADRMVELGLGGIGINDGLRELSIAFKNDGVYKIDTMKEDYAFNTMLSAGGDVDFILGRAWAVKDMLNGSGSMEGIGKTLLGVNGPRIYSWWDWSKRATALTGTIITDSEERAAAAEELLKDTGKTFVSAYGGYAALQAQKQFGYEFNKRGGISKVFEESWRSETATLFKIKPTEVESFYLQKEKTSGWFTGSATEEDKLADKLFQKAVDKIMLLPDEALGMEYGDALLTQIEKELTGFYATQPIDVATRVREKVDAKFATALSDKGTVGAKMNALLGKVAGGDGSEEEIEQAKELLASEWARTHPEIGAWLIPYLKQKEIIRETK